MRKFGQLYRRLMALVICGDDAGQEPLGDDAPWFADDEAHKPADVGTAARLLWQPEAPWACPTPCPTCRCHAAVAEGVTGTR